MPANTRWCQLSWFLTLVTRTSGRYIIDMTIDWYIYSNQLVFEPTNIAGEVSQRYPPSAEEIPWWRTGTLWLARRATQGARSRWCRPGRCRQQTHWEAGNDATQQHHCHVDGLSQKKRGGWTFYSWTLIWPVNPCIPAHFPLKPTQWFTQIRSTISQIYAAGCWLEHVCGNSGLREFPPCIKSADAVYVQEMNLCKSYEYKEKHRHALSYVLSIGQTSQYLHQNVLQPGYWSKHGPRSSHF